MKDEKYYGTALPTIVPHVVEFAQAKSTDMRDLTSACPSQISILPLGPGSSPEWRRYLIENQILRNEMAGHSTLNRTWFTGSIAGASCPEDLPYRSILYWGVGSLYQSDIQEVLGTRPRTTKNKKLKVNVIFGLVPKISWILNPQFPRYRKK